MIFSPNIYLPIYLCIDIYLFMIYISLSLYISIYLYTSLYTYMSSKFPHYGSKSPGSCWGVSFPLYMFLLLCLCVACLQTNSHSSCSCILGVDDHFANSFFFFDTEIRVGITTCLNWEKVDQPGCLSKYFLCQLLLIPVIQTGNNTAIATVPTFFSKWFHVYFVR